MSRVVLISASPAENSKTEALLEFIARRLGQYGHRTEFIKLRHLPASPLLAGDGSDGLISSARATVAAADAVVVGSPVFKATYTGLLKVFVDLLPMDALHGKPVLPLLTGGSAAHVLALDYGLKPLLATLGASSIGRGRFVVSSNVLPATDTTPPRIDESVERDVIDAIDQFDSELTVRARSCSHAEAAAAESLITAPITTERNPS
ncbi:NADPH-dependent FMN reductase [Brevibacterium sediminis]|uniref:NAD(P)H-dependent FMN reductase n=1 Tax=Brevibacterium sediminis TaxID=1857024 RepID=A0ABQ1MMR0_9MICO|nr:NADPH-dependent FMN reductase [Brevibacterium sediminis]GGC43431.1 NAD(P)H-dependent FMN reductase [Brevibacterium sediminis]